MDLDNIQRKYGLPAPLPVVQNGKFAPRFPLNLEHRGDDVFQFGGKYIGEIENIYDLLYKILTNQEIDASLALPYAIKITEDKLYIRDKTNSEWITIFDITKPNFPKEIELYELIYKAITHQVIGEDTSYPGQFKIEENILYVRDKDNLTWTQIGDVTKEFLGATEATQAILEQINEILIEVQELKTELNRQIATTNETLTTALKAANEAMTSAQSINIRTFNSVEEMKASNTLKAGALAKTLGFYTAGDGGGADYLITDNIGEDEADEASIIALQNNLYAKFLVTSTTVSVLQFGAKSGNGDATKAIQDCINFALENKIAVVKIPAGYFLISGYIDISTTKVARISIEGAGVASTILQCTNVDDESYKDKGLITVQIGTNSTDSQPENWGTWGPVFKNLHLMGYHKKMHGIYIRKAQYPLFDNINIENFNGSLLLIDKCQDGSFESCNFHLGGRLKEGQTDGFTTNDNTEYSPIHMISTVDGDSCNMLRFNKIQMENNNVSPFVHIDNGYRIWFDQAHVEQHTGTSSADFILANGGETFITNLGLAPTMRCGFIQTGYGSCWINGGYIGDIKINASGAYGTFCSISNAEVKAFSTVGYKFNGMLNINNCYLMGDLTANYLAGDAKIVNNVIDGKVDFLYSGSPKGNIVFKGNTVKGNLTKTGENTFFCTNNIFTGDTTISNGGGYYRNNRVSGTEKCSFYYDQTLYLPNKKEGLDTKPPGYGAWNVGDIVYNSNPTAGSYVGWVCVTAGSPGTWKGFGLIQS